MIVVDHPFLLVVDHPFLLVVVVVPSIAKILLVVVAPFQVQDADECSLHLS